MVYAPGRSRLESGQVRATNLSVTRERRRIVESIAGRVSMRKSRKNALAGRLERKRAGRGFGPRPMAPELVQQVVG